MPAEAPARRVVRRPFAAGDFLTRIEEGGALRFRVDAPAEKAGWRARIEPTMTSAEHPGTAVDVEGAWYEIVRASEVAGRVVYELAPWEDRFPIRGGFRYTAEEVERLERERRAREARAARALPTMLASPVLGLLPAVAQLEIEERSGVSAIHLTTVSAAFELLFGVLAMLVGTSANLAGAFGAGAGPAAVFGRLQLLWVAIVVDAAIRGASAVHANEPMGSFLAAPVRWFVPRWRGAPLASSLPATRRRGRREPAPDVVTALPDGSLEIVSELPKPHWGPRLSIGFGERWYRLESTAVEGEGDAERHRFVLRPLDDDELFGGAVRYEPGEVAALARELRRRETDTWVVTFAPLLGLTDAATQERLAAAFTYDAPRATLHGIAGAAVLGLGAAAVAFYNLAGGVPGAGVPDALVLAAGLALAAESALRLAAWREDRILGSVVGKVVRPFAVRWLREVEVAETSAYDASGGDPPRAL